MTGRHSVAAALDRFPGTFVVWTREGWRRIAYRPSLSANASRIAGWAERAEYALDRAAGNTHNRYSRPLSAPLGDETGPLAVRGERT